ncbi:MAG TPA: FAD/NAD(P)-binding oxidoreductase [Rhodanobacteraceae bacterium]
MTEHYDVLVVGAGPAGLAAARAASGHHRSVAVVDAQAMPGGQVWRHDVAKRSPRAARKAITALDKVRWLSGHTVVAGDTRTLRMESRDGAHDVTFDALVLATGARELHLPFPGWTLPGVTGAGGLQALTKQGWPMAGKRVLVAGTGPLLLAAASSLRSHGAKVVGIVEQAPHHRVAAFAGQLWRWPARAAQAVRLKSHLAGVPCHYGAHVREAFGNDGTLQAVTVENATGMQRIPCDLLAVGYGLVPNTRLAQLLGCRLQENTPHPGVQVDGACRTSVANVFAAGEICGIGGLAMARIEGTIAGHAAAGSRHDILAWNRRHARARLFADILARTFALDPSLHNLATPDTIVCRCEDVPLAALDGLGDLRSAKLASRCGMGACQGRICGSALTELGRIASPGVRPPLFPARMESLAAAHFSSTTCDHRGTS